MKGRFATRPTKYLGDEKWLLTLEVDEEPKVFDDLKDEELSIELKKYRKKRSLDANAYCWVLCSEIAKRLNTSKDEIYEEMIQRYSEFDRREDGGYVTITMLSIIPIERLGGHWRKIGDEGKFSSYMRLLGSSEMNTEQMSHLIDGIVSEARELGIDTETPEEIERIKNLWRNQQAS